MDRLTDEELALIELRAQEMRAPYARKRTVTELREIRQMLADVASALNVANVPTATTLDSGKLVGLPLPERIALLVRDRDDARKLAADVQSSLTVAHLHERPIPMRLTCPTCSALHIDEGEFATKVHHTHACQSCGAVWRPAVVATVGVRFLPGFKNKEGT